YSWMSFLQNPRAEAFGRLVFAGGHSMVHVRSARCVGAVRAVACAPVRGLQLADDVREAGVIFTIRIVIRADVAGLTRAYLFFLERLDDGALDHFAAAGIDRGRDVRVQLDAAVGVARGAVLVELAAALVAVACPQMVLAAAAGTAVRELAAGHGHKRAFGA